MSDKKFTERQLFNMILFASFMIGATITLLIIAVCV